LAGAFLVFPWVQRLVPDRGLAWGLSKVALPLAWGISGLWAGFFGVAHWWWGGVVALVLALGAVRCWGKGCPRPPWGVEAAAFAAFWLLVWLRGPQLAVTGTEKPMDLAILAACLRPQPLPPEDPWLAGFPLRYYFFGMLPWVLPAKLLGLAPDEAYNLLVPLHGALTVQLAMGVAGALGVTGFWRALSGFLAVFAGTPQGFLQLASSGSLQGVDLWASSRGIAGAITEFPLFTFWLGDLHPHLLCLPWVQAAVGTGVACREGVSRAWLGASLLWGAAAAANPWAAPMVGLVLALLAFGQKGGLVRLAGSGLLAALTLLPAWFALPKGVAGVGLVTRGTSLGESFAVLGGILVPVSLLAWEQVNRGWVKGAALASLVLAAAWGRPLFLWAAALASFYLWQAVKGSAPAALTSALVLLLAAMELVFVADPYGGEFYRMNTVFKVLAVVFSLGAVVVSWCLQRLFQKGRRWTTVVAAAVVASGLVHGVRVAGQAGGWPKSFRGLFWMAPGEEGAARFLHRQQGRLVEAVGEAYSTAARLAAASGMPTVLGWENHELLWRGGEVGPLLAARRLQVAALYRCADAGCVQRIASALGVRFVAVGAEERRAYPGLAEQALRQAGRVCFAEGGTFLVELAPP
jgi:YYY domain-containing protein